MIDTEFDLKITLRKLNPEIIKYMIENPQNVVTFRNRFQYPYRFSVSIDLNEHIDTILYLLRNFSDVYA